MEFEIGTGAMTTLPSKPAYRTFFDDRRAMMSLVGSGRPGLLVPCRIRRKSRHPEIPVDLVHVLPDGEPRMLGRPAELLAQNRSDDRGRFLRRSPAEELQADASREHILDGDRHVTGALDDFGANGRKTFDDGLGETSVFLGDIQDHGRGGAKSARQVLRGLLGNTVIPYQAHPVDRCKTIRTGQGAISREARGHRQAQGPRRAMSTICRLAHPALWPSRRDQRLDDTEQNGRRDPEHQHPGDGLERPEEPPGSRHDDVTVPEGREVHGRVVEGGREVVELAAADEKCCPRGDLHELSGHDQQQRAREHADTVHPVSAGIASRNLPPNEAEDGGDRRRLDHDQGRDHHAADDERNAQLHAEARSGSTRNWCRTKTRVTAGGSRTCGQDSRNRDLPGTIDSGTWALEVSSPRWMTTSSPQGPAPASIEAACRSLFVAAS